MKYDIRLFKKKNFEVKLFIGHGTYFIVSDDRRCIYLHKDGTLRDHCGDPNFFDTKAEAHALLNSIFFGDILDEELFTI